MSRWLCSLLLLLLLPTCGGGGGDADPVDPGLTGGWVEILLPTDSGSYTTACNELFVYGEAFISTTEFRCCTGDASDTGVTVTWTNLDTGQSGTTSQSVGICFLFGTPYLCNHTWSATVPLALGGNRIQVTARDTVSGGSDDIAVAKPAPSYAVSGHLYSDDGRGVGYFQSGIELRLEELGQQAIASSAGPDVGRFEFSCVTAGVHTLRPTSPFSPNPMDPELRTVVVGSSDVAGQDFDTGTWFISGQVTWASSGAPAAAQWLKATSIDGEWSWFTLDDGSYRFALPPGRYTIEPFDLLCPTCVYAPANYQVDLVAADLTGLAFTRTAP